MTVSVTDHGAVGDGTTDDTAAILAAQSAAGNEHLYFPPGTYLCSATLTAQHIVGDSREHSVLRYTGSGAAISVVDPTVRSHNKLIRDLAIVTPTAGTVALDGVPGAGTPVAGTTGIDLASHSRAHVSNVTVAGFEYGVHIHGPQSPIYNTFVDVVAGACAIGFYMADYLCNEERFFGCRANLCTTGWRIIGGDHNILIGCSVESSGEGVRITGSDADGCIVSGCRFENNSGLSVYVGPDVPNVTVVDNEIWPTAGGLDIRSPRRVVRDSRRPHTESVTDWGSEAWVFERNLTAGTNTAAFVISDTYANWGTPTALLLKQERWQGHFVRGTRAGTELWRINGDGVIKPRATSTLPSAAEAGPGGMAYHTGTKKPVWSDGSVWRYADGTAV